MRVLNKFPLELPELDILQQDREYNNLISQIETALDFISHTIKPSFKRQVNHDQGQAQDQQPAGRRITKEKLVELWEHNQRRAIDTIINNDSLELPPISCQIEHERLMQYCTDKTKRTLQGPLPIPPWQEDFSYDLPEYNMNSIPFTQKEVENVIKSCKCNTAPGFDGVEYKTLKSHKQSLIPAITGIVNTCLVNRKVPHDWKHSLVVQIPKKGGDPNNPEDWRHISLLLSSYKIYMKLLQSRAMPWIVDTGRLSSKQKGSLPRNGLQEHVFCLRSEISNLKHISSKLFVTFVDIKDAFGSLDHEYMLKVMQLCNYPAEIVDITRDIYTDSTFQLITAQGLTPKVTRHKGIIQGCPWSVIAFIQAMDPWIRWVSCPYNVPCGPNPCQAYIDDVDMIATTEDEKVSMIEKTDIFMTYTGMKVKHRKCALLHGQRSGNNWYPKSKTDRLVLEIQGDQIPKYPRSKTYTYLGHAINMDGDGDLGQIKDLVGEFENKLNKIDQSPLPVSAKLNAINIICMSQLNFYFCNLTFTEKVLKQLEDMIVEKIRNWMDLNKSSTRSVMFIPQKKGGLGVLKPTISYHSKKVSFMISVLNNDDTQVRATARSSLELHMSKRKVLMTDDHERPNFAGYMLGGPGKLAKGSKVNWSKSDWVDLCELCHRIGIKMLKVEDTYKAAIPQDDDIEFLSDNHKLVYANLKHVAIEKEVCLWKEKVNQGRLARECIDFADMSLSCQHLRLLGLSDRLIQFVVKGRLQLLETQSMLYIYYPNLHTKRCPSCNHPTDTTSHVLNGCMTHRQCYIQRHDRSVDHIHNELLKMSQFKDCRLLKNKVINNNVFPNAMFDEVQHTKPDIIVIDDENNKVYIVELSHPYDAFIESCYQTKFDKYFPLSLAIQGAGYQCTIIVLIIGSLGHVHKRFVPGLKRLGMSQIRAKAIAKYLSVSSMIGSYRVWRRRWR